MRLFVSIDIPVKLQEKLASIVPKHPDVKPTKKEQLHITLQFLGERSGKEAELIKQKLREISFNSFELWVQKIGAFPDQDKPRVIWAGVKHQKKLLTLQKNVATALSEFTEQGSDQKFIPHITLARTKSALKTDLTDSLFGLIDPVNFFVDSFLLKVSELHPDGSQHKTIQTFESLKTEKQ